MDDDSVEARVEVLEAMVRLLIATMPPGRLEAVSREFAGRIDDLPTEIRKVGRSALELLQSGLDLDAARPLDEALAPESSFPPE